MTKLLKILLAAFFAFGMIACEEQKDPDAVFLGTWKLNQTSINDINQTLSPCELNATLTFEGYNLCKHYDACIDTTINDSWSYNNNSININSLLPVSFEIEEVSSTALHIKSYDFDSTGEVRISKYEYIKISE